MATFFNRNIEDTYQFVLQNESGILQNGEGNYISSLNLTGSHLSQGTYSGSFYGDNIILTGSSSVITGSFTGSFDGVLSGSMNGDLNGEATGSFTGSLDGHHTGSLDGEATGSFTGSFHGESTGSFTGSLDGYHTGSLNGEATGSFTGSFYGELTGSFSGSGIIASSSLALDSELLDGKDSTIFATTGSNTFTGAQVINNTVSISTSLTLSQSDPLPTGGVGKLAVSSSNLYYHNGSSWAKIN